MPKTAPVWENRIVKRADIPPDQLLANPKNFRRHTREQKDAFRGLVAEVGYIDPVLCTLDEVVIDGHLRVEVALEDGIATIPVDYYDGTAEQADLILATKDPLAAMAYHDQAALDALLAEVMTEDAAIQALLDSLRTDQPVIAGLTDPDDMPPVPEVPVTKPGDLWLLGRHRLLCGDATVVTDVERLMDGERAQMILTSPPYGVGKDYEGQPDFDATVELVQDVFSLWCPLIRANGFAFVNFCDRYIWPQTMGQVYFDLFAANGWRWYDQRYWKRSQVGLAIWNTTQPRSMSQIEHIWTYQNGNGIYPVHDLDISKEQLWDDQGSSAGKDHPAVMAEGVANKAIQIYSNLSDVVVEPFAGAGTTIIAAEHTGRVCYAMEILPKYCDVTVTRWERFTGGTAILAHDHAMAVAD